MDYIRMYYPVFYILLFQVFYSEGLALKHTECEPVSPCRCVYGNGYQIDLTPLNNPDKSFLIESVANVAYFYHPCGNMKLVPSNVSLDLDGVLYFYMTNNISTTVINTTEILLNGTGFTQLATAEQFQFQNTLFGLIPQITYTNNNITTTVELNCIPEGSNSQSKLSLKNSLSIGNLTHHDLVLTSPYSCRVALTDAPTTEATISTGSVLLILFFTFASAYFFGGALVLKFIRGAEGREMIPNYEFWVDLPYLVRDGCVFAMSCGQHSVDSYERI